MREPKYKMTVDLNVLEHLGINLYSNIAAVLTEAVANAWDADAKEVDITIDDKKKMIVIEDNGTGMTIADMNEKYLRVGYRRRDDGGADITPKFHRPVMGRKGLGKLSLFSIAEVIEVQSAKGSERHGLIMDLGDIRKAFAKKCSFYAPTSMPAGQVKIRTGTRIVLRKVTKKAIGRSIEPLRTQLARRFSIIAERSHFAVSVNESPITIDDRSELKKAQFLWAIGDSSYPEIPKGSSIVEKRRVSISDDCGVRGWIATSRFPKDLATKAGNLNVIVVMARGRLIQEDILAKLNDGRIYTKYLTGQIEADFLDDSGEDDIATSDRQRLKEDDPRYLKLLEVLKALLSKVEADWNELRKEREVKNIQEEIPAVKEWLDGLKPGTKKNAEKMMSQISMLHIDNSTDRNTLIKHGILAFERMELRGSADELAAGVVDVNKLLIMLASRDDYEAALYSDIVKSRLDVIRLFTSKLTPAKKEKVLQKHLFKNLWLLDSMWERASDGVARIEETLKKEFKKAKDSLTRDENKGRLDIRYKTSAGTHIIVELKKYDRKVGLPELLEQGQKYKSALIKCLLTCGAPNPDVRIVFVLGRPVPESENTALGGPRYVEDQLKPLNAKVVYYDEMVANAQKAYGDYLEKDKELGRLDAILKKLS